MDDEASPFQHQSFTSPPPPVITTATAIQYITELHRFYQSLPVTHLPNPDPKIPKLVVSKLIGQAKKIKKCLIKCDSYSFNLSVTN